MAEHAGRSTARTVLSVFKWIVVLGVLGVLTYLIWWYIRMPYRLDDLAGQYNDLVDKFNTAVKLTTIAYMHIGSKEEKMPVTMSFRSVNGIEKLEVAADNGKPLLYDDQTNTVNRLIIVGYESPTGHVFFKKLTVLVGNTNDDWEYTTAIDSFFSDSGQKETGNRGDPSINIECNEGVECLKEKTTYKLVANDAGAFHLRSIDPEKDNINSNLPTERPKYVNYKMQANTRISSSPF